MTNRTQLILWTPGRDPLIPREGMPQTNSRRWIIINKPQFLFDLPVSVITLGIGIWFWVNEFWIKVNWVGFFFPEEKKKIEVLLGVFCLNPLLSAWITGVLPGTSS